MNPEILLISLSLLLLSTTTMSAPTGDVTITAGALSSLLLAKLLILKGAILGNVASDLAERGSDQSQGGRLVRYQNPGY